MSIAAEAAARGADVTLIDNKAPGSGTSSVSYAWVNSNGKEPAGYYELNRAGLEAHHRLAGGGGDWFRPTGHIELAATPEHVKELHRRLERLGQLRVRSHRHQHGRSHRTRARPHCPGGLHGGSVLPS